MKVEWSDNTFLTEQLYILGKALFANLQLCMTATSTTLALNNVALRPVKQCILYKALVAGCPNSHHSSGAVRESRWTSWAVRPNEPSGFRGRKDLLNRASALVTTCP